METFWNNNQYANEEKKKKAYFSLLTVGKPKIMECYHCFQCFRKLNQASHRRQLARRCYNHVYNMYITSRNFAEMKYKTNQKHKNKKQNKKKQNKTTTKGDRPK